MRNYKKQVRDILLDCVGISQEVTELHKEHKPNSFGYVDSLHNFDDEFRNSLSDFDNLKHTIFCDEALGHRDNQIIYRAMYEAKKQINEAYYIISDYIDNYENTKDIE